MNIVDLRDLADELDALQAETPVDPDDRARVDALLALQDELNNGSGLTLREIGEGYEPTLIAEADFVEYAQELAEDCGMIDPNAAWPANCIDWEQAARELRYDYTPVSFDGIDYLIRSW